MFELDTAAKEADEAAVIDLAEDPDLVEDLLGALGVSELGALDSDHSAIIEESFVDLAVAARAKEAVAGEVVGGSLDLLAGEDFSRPAAAIGVEDLFALSGETILRFFDAAVAFVD